MTNIYCKLLPTFISMNFFEDVITTSYQKMLHKLLPSPQLDQLPSLAHNLLPNQPRRPAGTLSSQTVQIGDLATTLGKFDSGVGGMMNEGWKMLMTNMPLCVDFASMGAWSGWRWSVAAAGYGDKVGLEGEVEDVSSVDGHVKGFEAGYTSWGNYPLPIHFSLSKASLLKFPQPRHRASNPQPTLHITSYGSDYTNSTISDSLCPAGAASSQHPPHHNPDSRPASS